MLLAPGYSLEAGLQELTPLLRPCHYALLLHSRFSLEGYDIGVMFSPDRLHCLES